MLLILFSISLCFSWVSPESHSLRYYYTSMLNSGDFPEFIHVGVLDGVQITYYDSIRKKDIPRQPWMRTSLDDQYWEQETQRLIDRERLSLANVQIATRRTNSSETGLNYLQYTSGCELLEDGTVTGKRHYAFNGRELISFDLEHSTWVAISPYAESTQRKWNSNAGDNEYKRYYTKKICIEWLNTYLRNGAAVLNRKDVPEANVYYTNGHNVNLHCLVTGFYPQSINVTWLADGKPVPDTHSTGILPNHDGTYQIRVAFQMKHDDGRNYVCHIEHSSLPAPKEILWEKDGSVVAVMIGCIILLLLLILCIGAGVYCWKHKDEVNKRITSCLGRGYMASNSSANSTDGSQTLNGNNSDSSDGEKPLISGPLSNPSMQGNKQSVQTPLVQNPDGPPQTHAETSLEQMTVEIETYHTQKETSYKLCDQLIHSMLFHESYRTSQRCPLSLSGSSGWNLNTKHFIFGMNSFRRTVPDSVMGTDTKALSSKSTEALMSERGPVVVVPWACSNPLSWLSPGVLRSGEFLVFPYRYCSSKCFSWWKFPVSLLVLLATVWRMESSKRGTMILHLTALTLLTAAGAHAGSHSLQYLFIYAPLHRDLPQLSMIGMLDDLQIEYYDSSLNRIQPRQQWMASKISDDYWQEQTMAVDALQNHIFRKTAPVVTMLGIQYIQVLWECTVENSQNTTAFVKINVNGFGDVECDLFTVRCRGLGVFSSLSGMFEDILKHDPTFIQLLNPRCVESLQTVLRAGKTALERKVVPQVLVFKRSSTVEMSTPLLCLITAFYPRTINATWLHNGEPVSEDLTVRVLPNHDATYRMELIIDIKNNDPSSYCCQVQHHSSCETLRVTSGVARVSHSICPGPMLCLFIVLAIVTGVA
ncbi:uncharacterized protein LOC125467716 [Stegostoma tigrinum]|uniref:uncharacterized protein LOC125467716 n=1 Tax=Stegostoma tigrinum TaxID=3053191 RepID=UPI00286FAFBB|nr:uncharacterized protein LOC125467716 [Stegostoma tigrinum]